ncbi:hypothetical protein EX30DRAFT_124346 [Ascodesmis nigricans]|uniref:GPI anchored serine-rich protein n=1 Tax=Ascodesmis nigricans TaxID=341454 RepID=A0A4S2MP83_9PEZI|nr:hypothetical protein EX30DRAFT_124346 [Ascodesmis nigricans]
MQAKFFVALAALATGVVADVAAPAGGLVARGEEVVASSSAVVSVAPIVSAPAECAPPVTVTVTVCATETPEPSLPVVKPSSASTGFPPKPTNGTSAPPKTTPTPPQFEGAAARTQAGALVIGGAIAVAAYLL